MRERFTNRQVTAMVVAFCAAVAINPLTVGAATGQLVNITDPATSSYQARVGKAGTLSVESRAGAVSRSFNSSASVDGLGWVPIKGATAPNQLVLTEVTISPRLENPPPTALFVTAQLWALVRASGSGSCTGTGATGYTSKLLRTFHVPANDTTALTFPGPPLLVPMGATGQPACVGVYVTRIPTGTSTFVGATGYILP